jgi:hypothetical protein
MKWRYYIGTGGRYAGHLYRKKIYYWQGYDPHRGEWVDLKRIFASTNSMNNALFRGYTPNAATYINYSRKGLQKNTKRLTDKEAFMEML